jgi:ribosome-associated protein
VADGSVLCINDETSVPLSEVRFEFSRASGPGGQHVNKASTRAVLCFSVPDSSALSDEQKQRVMAKLRNRIARDGLLRVGCSQHRSQTANRAAATMRFCELLAEALRAPKTRRATRPSKAARERRLQEKRHHSRLKQSRRPPAADD